MREGGVIAGGGLGGWTGGGGAGRGGGPSKPSKKPSGEGGAPSLGGSARVDPHCEHAGPCCHAERAAGGAHGEGGGTCKHKSQASAIKHAQDPVNPNRGVVAPFCYSRSSGGAPSGTIRAARTHACLEPGFGIALLQDEMVHAICIK